MRFDIPRGEILEIRDAEILFDPAPHPYETQHAAAIEANWQEEASDNPAFFDGTVMLFSEIGWKAKRLRARCHAIRFATLLHWRRIRDAGSAEHLYAQAMPVAADGSLVAIRMGAHTANAGRIHFAAGSLEPADVVGGRVDLDRNMAREVLEETGVDISGCPRDALLHGRSANGGTVITRRYFLDEPADAIAERIRAFIANEAEPEITEPVIIRHASDLPDGLMPYMAPLIEWHFGSGKAGSAG